MKTMEQIADFARREKGVKVQNKTDRLHVQIDGLAISDMLDHTDYGNADEVGGLVGLCKEIFGDLEFWDKLYKSTLENLMIRTWVDHIIHSCKWNTEYDCLQNVNTLCLLWKEITDTISINKIDESKTHLKRQKCDHIIEDCDYDEAVISVCLQFLQSFVNENNAENDRILIRVWRRFGIYRKQTLVYLLLYTTYLEYRYELIDYSWILREEFEFRVCMREIIKGYFWWDEHFAVKCWLDWSRYDYHENIDLTKFMQFSNDIKNLQNGKRYKVKSPILIRVVGGIE